MNGKVWVAAAGVATLAFSGALLALPAIVGRAAMILADDLAALLVAAVDDAWPVAQ